MKKTGKKKNYQLRRRVQRTVAAILLVMAVVVAAVPVENLGTTQAADASAVSADISYNPDNYDDDGNAPAYDFGKYESSYADDGFEVQQIDSSASSFTNLFTVKKSTEEESDNAIIVSADNLGTSSPVINDKEYYSYVQFTSAYTEAVYNTYVNENFTVGFKTEETEKSGKDSTKKITLITIDESSYDDENDDSLSLPSLNSDSYPEAQGYVNYNGTLTNKEIFENCGSLLSDRQTAIETYNASVEALTEKIDALNNSDSDYSAKWESYASQAGALEKKAESLKKLSAGINEFGAADNGLNAVVNYIIVNYCTYGTNALSNSSTNTAYELVKLKSTGLSGSTLYVPHSSSKDTVSTGQCLDSEGYLALGGVYIVGIGSNAFKGKSKLQTLTITAPITFIGAEAFKDCTNLTTVTINDEGCEIIGGGAFRGCYNLRSFTSSASANSGVKTIDKDAFYGTALTSVTIPSSVTAIGAGAFANMASLASLGFASRTTDIDIGKYAFFDCRALADVTFGLNIGKYKIYTAAFAVTSGNSGSLTSFEFPANEIIFDTESKDDYDYILANRTKLNYVVFPNYENAYTIPDNTLAGCWNLSYVLFPDDAGYASYDAAELFQSVYNEDFYVEGPEYSVGKTEAVPRTTTWAARAGKYDDGTYCLETVPYKYTDSAGVVHFEIGVWGTSDETVPSFIAAIEVTNESKKEAALTSYFINTAATTPTSTSRYAVTVPAEVGGYTVTTIEKGCFSKISAYVYKIVIEDGGIQTIADEAFSGMSVLEWVEIGDAVTYIGEKAFYECSKLENVVFSQNRTQYYDDDSDYWTELEIGEDAFKTESEYLTFHGAINENYAPYALAMSDESDSMTNTGRHICYKTDAPLHLTVIWDETTSQATLIDYPHYEEIDTLNADEIEDAFTELFVNGENSEELTSAQKAVALQTLYMELPSGIQSIDSKKYFESDAGDDAAYLGLTYTEYGIMLIDTGESELRMFTRLCWDRQLNANTSGYETDVKKLYSTYTIEESSSGVNVIPGLYSGYFDESADETNGGGSNDANAAENSSDGGSSESSELFWRTSAYNSHYYTENNNRGNDYLTSIDMQSVESLPDYAFDSAENLLTVAFSSAMDEGGIGALPFRDCKSLYDIDTGDSVAYQFENMLLYENSGDDTNLVLEIIECLEGRGDVSGSTKISSSTNPYLSYVTSIADYAFSNAEYISEVDLSDTTVKTIPTGAFSGDTKLTQVTLPSTTASIEEDAFEGAAVNYNLTVTIPNPYCVIANNAFDINSTSSTTGTAHVTIEGVKYIDEATEEESPCYQSYLALEKIYGEDNIEFSDMGNSYIVTFVDYDGSYITSEVVDSGESATPPSDPTRTGYAFVEWVCYRQSDGAVLTGSDTYTNVTENRVIYATYESDPSAVVSDGSTYTLTIVDGSAYVPSADATYTSSVTLAGGTTVVLIADDTDNFKVWTISPADYYGLLSSTSSSTTTMTMPNASVTVTANSGTSSSDLSGSSSSDDDDDDDDDDSTTYTLTVNYGSGSGDYAAGTTVSISAYAPESSSKVFSKWTSSDSGVGFSSAASSTTTLVMPASDLTVTANYKTRSSDDNDDNDDDDSSSSSRRTGTTTGTTGSTGTTTTTTTTTTETVSGSADGSKIYITKNGISNKDVASVTVDGSTDNFIVRITESDEATEAVKAALINEYGSLDGLVYFPMDISLYDATGQNKITDTYGLNITITMPIPDVLIQYGGNNRVASADDGVLGQLTPKFTTIDGIACISFTPQHFSPYAIYVDTNNLIAGLSLDSTPKTGDSIHPKWFLAVGMACLSVILFVTSDGRKRKRRIV